MSTQPTAPWSRLRSDLSSAAAKAAGPLRAAHVNRAWRESLDTALLLSLLVPALGLVFAMTVWKPPFGLLVFLTPLVPAAWVSFRVWQASCWNPSLEHCVSAVDRDLKLQDRLITAHEFLAKETRTPFMEAALDDATRFVDQARSHDLSARSVPPTRVERGFWALPVVAVLLLLPQLWIQPASGTLVPEYSGDPARVEVANVVTRDRKVTEADDETFRPDAPERAPRVAKPRVGDELAAEPTPDRENELSGEAKKTVGQTRSGQSSHAMSASGASDSRGNPSRQAQVSRESEKAKKKEKKKTKRKRKDEEAMKPRKGEDESGGTAGRGAATGSNRSPSASPWSSRDQVVSEDEADLDQDEDVDDETEESEARGGLQPGLRDRKPPVNRDLTIGFGNQKNPDANGRGGPSEQKKSRGVASLVLGVPIPDHVKGRPNPGKTKVTQERVEPRADSVPTEVAQSRAPRASEVGHLGHPELTPWMRTLLEKYYLSIRPETASRDSK